MRKAKISADELLRRAAPDLYEALRLLHDDIADYQSINNLGGYDNHCMKLARAALAKAKADRHIFSAKI